MKVAIPVLGDNLKSEISAHFGKAPAFIIFDTETEKTEVLTNTGEHFGGRTTAAQLLVETGIKTLLCGQIGPKAISMFSGLGVDVFVGATGTAEEAIERWKSGKLNKASQEESCNNHRHKLEK